VISDSLYAAPSAVRSYQRNSFHILRMVFHAPVQIILFPFLLLLQVVVNPEDIKTKIRGFIMLKKHAYIYNMDKEWRGREDKIGSIHIVTS
jgi:hypothetical protein